MNLKNKMLVGIMALGLSFSSSCAADADKEIFMCKFDTLSNIVKGYKFVDYSSTKSLYVDKSTVTTSSDGSKAGWIIFASLRADSEAYRDNEGYTRTYVKFDKTKKKYMAVKSVGYNCSGDITVNYRNDTAWEMVVPNSLFDSLAKEL